MIRKPVLRVPAVESVGFFDTGPGQLALKPLKISLR
jgi:hypothetical protein